MKRYNFILVIFTVLIISLFFIATVDAAGICDMEFTDERGTKMSADDWCTVCGGETFHFCKGNIHYSFGCKKKLLFWCDCDENTAREEICTAGCNNWYCSKDPAFCVDGSCNQLKTCSELTGGTGDCCPPGQFCTLDKILGASNCDECCKDVSKCSPPCVNPRSDDGTCTPGCNVDQDPDCGCKGGNGVCPTGCDYTNDSDCPTCVNPVKGDKICTPGCSVDQDPDCGCKSGDYYCGIGCDYTNDSDCPKTCSQWGRVCCSPDICDREKISTPDCTECCPDISYCSPSDPAKYCSSVLGGTCCPPGHTCDEGRIFHPRACDQCCTDINDCSALAQTCSALGGECCPPGKICTVNKIPGASGCVECCKNLNDCSAEGPPSCGNGTCESGENTTNCPADCAVTPPTCNNDDVCESGETAANCPHDCGGGPPPPPGPSGGIEFQNPLEYGTFGELIDKIMNFIFLLAVAAVPLIIIIGAFHLLTSGGDIKKIGTGKSMITYALIGLAIILLARGIIAMIQQAIGVK